MRPITALTHSFDGLAFDGLAFDVLPADAPAPDVLQAPSRAQVRAQSIDVTDGDGKCVRRIATRRPVQVEQHPHHVLHLLLGCTASTGDRLFDPARCVFGDCKPRPDQSHKRSSSCLTQFKGRTRATRHEHLFDGGNLRGVIRNNLLNATMDLGEPGREFANAGADATAGNIGKITAQNIYDSITGRPGPRVDAEHPCDFAERWADQRYPITLSGKSALLWTSCTSSRSSSASSRRMTFSAVS